MSQTSTPLVHILTTGGTIASQTDAPAVKGHQLIVAVPQLEDHARVEVEEFSRIGSSKMTPDHWLRLAKRIQELLDTNPAITSIIITHGTDSMEETAFFLNLTVRSERPIVLVGSMRASNEVSADGSANLINAVRVGVSPQSIGKGVIVAMNEQLFSARDLVKIQNRRTNAFESLQGGSLGIVHPDTVFFYRQPMKPPTKTSEFSIESIESLPIVDIVQDFVGIDPAILDYHLNRGIDGLVIQSFAGGRVSAGTRQWIERLDGNHIPVVIASSIIKGRIVGNPHEGRSVILSPDLKGNKARILLMLAMLETKDTQKIRDIFNRY